MATYRQRTTPGVYITELEAFPRSVVGVQTAIPAFIGYTQTAQLNGKPIYFMPIKINSLKDYEAMFGGGYHAVYNIDGVKEDVARSVQGSMLVAPVADSATDNYDFGCMRQSGSPPVWAMEYYKVSRVDADSFAPPFSPQVGQDLDDDAGEQDTGFELPRFNLYNALRLFYANGGGTCYIVSVGQYDDNGTPTTVTKDALRKGLDAIKEQSGPTMLVVPDAVLLPPNPLAPSKSDFYDICQDMLTQCHLLQDRVAILDVYGAGMLNQQHTGWDLEMNSVIEVFREGVGDAYLNYGMAYFPFLKTTIVAPDEINYTNFNIHDAQQLHRLQGILDDQADLLYAGKPQQRDTVKGYVALMKPDPDKPKTPAEVTRLNQNLVNAIPLFKEMQNVMVLKVSLMAPSAAMAGVYTFTDSTRGVWNAPANVALSSVVAPNVKLNGDQQGDLNVPLDGKAINVIRQFAGRGPVVWGARTLDGNSGDWRYIQVRRTLIYIEQSIETALQPFVFAANDGKTWVAVTSMVSNFLQGVWSQGGLMGAKADEAFTVTCGLGSTMTPMDVIDGYMILQITLQMIRPAEFIEVTFKQKMQGLA